MGVKDIAIKSIEELPETATWDDIEDRIIFLAAIDKGRENIKYGRIMPHEEVKKSLEKWITD